MKSLRQILFRVKIWKLVKQPDLDTIFQLLKALKPVAGRMVQLAEVIEIRSMRAKDLTKNMIFCKRTQ
jgi:hypothetical protein